MSRQINYSNPSARDKQHMDQRPWLHDEVARLADEPEEEMEDEQIDLNTLKAAELRELCDENGLDTTGTKPQLIERLVEFFDNEAEDSEDDGGDGEEQTS